MEIKSLICEEHKVTLVEPSANQTLKVTMLEGQDVVLNFDEASIEGMQVDQNGDLVIYFKNESTLILENAEYLVSQDNPATISFASGENLDVESISNIASVNENSITETINVETVDATPPTVEDVVAENVTPETLNAIEPAAGEPVAKKPMLLVEPSDNTQQVIQLEKGEDYKITFGQDQVQSIEQQGEQLVITFDNGGTLIIPNYGSATEGEEAANVLNQSGTPFAPSEVQQFLALSQQLNDIEPAAGEPAGGGASNTGFGFGSAFQSTPLNSLDAIGPINPTALRYPFPDIEEDVLGNQQNPTTPNNQDPQVNADDQIVYEDGSVELVLDVSPAAATDQLTVTISGIDTSWGVDTSVVGGTYDAVTGTWTGTLPTGAGLTKGPIFSPPADSDGDMTGLTLEVTVTHGDGSTAVVSDGFQIITDAVVDTPDLNAAGGTGAEDTAIPVTISTAATDTDGSESITSIVISGVPAGAMFNNGTDLGGGQWEMTLADLTGLTITPPTNFSGTIPMDVTVVAEETTLTDTEVTLANNVTSTTEPFVVTVEAVPDQPWVETDDVWVKEDGSVDFGVLAGLADKDGSEVLTVSISGIDPAWGVDTSASGGTFDAVTGTWSITLPSGTFEYNGGPTFSPPADSDADMDGLVVTATATETSNGLTNSVSTTADVNTDAVVDTPTLSANDVTGAEDTAIALDITTAVTDLDGSEDVTNIILSGVPAGATLNNGTDLGGGQWQLTLADLTGLTITPPANYNGNFNMTVEVEVTDINLSGDENDYTDNVTTVTDTLTVTVTPEADPPKVTAKDLTVKEDGSVDIDVTAELTGGPADVLTVTIAGFDTTWTVDTTTSGGTYDAVTGTWTITLPAGQNFSGGPTVSPPADSDIDMTGLVVTASEYDPQSQTSSEATADFDIITDAVIDDPTLTANNSAGDEDNPIDLDITTAVGESADGSEEITNIVISGVPAGATLNNGTDLGGGQWQLTTVDLTGLQLNPPLDFSGTINLTVSVTSTEVNLSGDEFDYTDNQTTVDAPLTVTVNPVADEPKLQVEDVWVKEDGSVALNITAEPGDTDGSEYLTLTVTGFDPSWGVDTSVSGGTYDAVTGTWTITMPAGQGFAGGPIVSPPADSDADMDGLVVTATSTETVGGDSKTVTDTMDVNTDAVVDTPTLTADDANGEQGTAIDLDIATAVTDTDGSEEVTNIVISGVPAGATLNNGTDLGGGQWQLTTADLTGLQIITPAGLAEGSYTLSVAVTVEDINLSGDENDYTDNVTTVTEDLILDISKDDEPMIIKPDTKTVDETNFDVVDPLTVSGQVNANYFSDAPGEITATGAGSFTSSTALASNGAAVTVVLVGNVYTGVANAGTPNATNVFDLTVNTDGSYTFNQYETLDHPDTTDPDDVITLDFGVTATDSDGDTDTSTITINVLDDGPVANDDFNRFNSTDGSTDGNVVSGRNGGAGAEDDLSNDVSNTVTKVIFKGTEYDVPESGTVSVDGDYGTLEIDANGEYTYTFDEGSVTSTSGGSSTLSPDSSANGETSITNDGITVSVGSPSGGSLTWHTTTSVGQGIGVASPSGGSAKVYGSNESLDIDFAQGASKVTITLADIGSNNLGDGVDYNVYLASDPTTPVTLEFQIPSSGVVNGTVSFDIDVADIAPGDTIIGVDLYSINNSALETTSFLLTDVTAEYPASGPDCVEDQFTYVLTDGDIDSEDAVLTIKTDIIPDDQPEIISVENLLVDETDFNAGLVTADGTVTADFFGDNPGTFSATGEASFSSSVALTSNGVAVTVALVGSTYTGSAGGNDVFTLDVNADGTYSFELLGTLDHPEETDPNDDIQLNFGVTATDSDGDIATGNVVVTVLDDGPVANDDFNRFSSDDVMTDGNVISGRNGGTGAEDAPSQDVDNTVTKVIFKGTEYDVPETGTVEVQGDFGKLVIDADGEYTYTFDPSSVTTTSTPGGSSTLNPTSAAEDTTEFSNDGITVRAGKNVITGHENNELTWVTTHDVGSGIGVDTIGQGDSAKVWNPGEVLDIDFAQAANKVTITLADIGSNNFGDGIDYKVYLESDPSNPVVLEFELPSYVADGLATFTIDVADLAPGDGIVGVDLYSIKNGSLDPSSFLLNNVVAEYPGTTTNVDCVEDQFEYVLTDGDEDTDTATLTIKTDVENDTPEIISVENLIVDETDFNAGAVMTEGQVTADFFGDNPGTFNATGQSSFSSSTSLTSNGLAVTVAMIGGSYVGSTVNEDIFKLDVNSDGTYKFELIGALDHPDATDPNDAIQLTFGVTARDSNGDEAFGDIKVDVLDDAPIARNDLNEFTSKDTFGDVISGYNGGAGADDTQSQDGETYVTKVAFNGVEYDVPASGYATVQGENGVLKIAANGDYTYEADADCFTCGDESSTLNPDDCDVQGETSFSNDGITVSVGNNIYTGSDAGKLTWVSTHDVGSGIGIDTAGQNDSHKVWNPGEVLDIDFDKGACKVSMKIADIGSNNFGDGIDYKVYLASDPSTPVELEFKLPSYDGDGVVDFTIDVEDIAPGDTIVGVDLYSISNSGLGTTSFLLNNVTAEYPSSSIEDAADIFTYTIADADGDTSSAYLVMNRDLNADDDVYVAQNDQVDTFVIEDDGGADLIVGFNADEGDSLDISQVLHGFDPMSDALSDFVKVDIVNDNAEIQVNKGGSFETVAILHDTVDINIDDLITDTSAVV